MTTPRRRKTHFPHLVQVRMSNTQKAFVDSLAPDKANQAAQVRKVFNQLIRHCLYDGTAPTAFYNYLAAHEPIYWEQVSNARAIPGEAFLPAPYNQRPHRPYPPLDPHYDPEAQRKQHSQTVADAFAGWGDDAPKPQHHAAPQHHATAQVYAPAPQAQHNPGFAQVAPAGPYDHLPNSQRPPMHRKTRVKPGYRMSDAELAQEGKRMEAHSIAQATGQPLPVWELAPWEELIPDDQV